MSDCQLLIKDCGPQLGDSNSTVHRRTSCLHRQTNCLQEDRSVDNTQQPTERSGVQAQTNLQPQTGSEDQLMTSLEAEWDAKAQGPRRDKQKKYGVRIVIHSNVRPLHRRGHHIRLRIKQKEEKTWQCRDEKESLRGKEPAVRQTKTGR